MMMTTVMMTMVMLMMPELKLGRVSEDSFNDSVVEILAALQKLGQQVLISD
jgi:hypothetical protein